MKTPFSRVSSTCLAVFAAAVVITAGGTVASIATGTVPAAAAQDQSAGPPPEGRQGGHHMGQLLEELNLTDAQKSQIRGIMMDARKQNKDVTDRDTRRANMKTAFEKIDTVLTPAQRTQLHAKLDAMRQQQDAHAQ